jgi:sec-independent protein translocase protein TatB
VFDIAPSELLLVAVVALLVIGPKDLPLALRTAGRWLGKVRRMSNHFRSGVETMIREAELAEIEKEWQDRNARIMAEHPDAEGLDAGMTPRATGPVMEPLDQPAPLDPATAEAALTRQTSSPAFDPDIDKSEPELPLSKPRRKRRG